MATPPSTPQPRTERPTCAVGQPLTKKARFDTIRTTNADETDANRDLHFSSHSAEKTLNGVVEIKSNVGGTPFATTHSLAVDPKKFIDGDPVVHSDGYRAFTATITQFKKQCTQTQNMAAYMRIQQNLSALLEEESHYTLRFNQEHDFKLWPSQSHHQAIMDHVFYPHEAIEESHQIFGAEFSMDHWMLTTRSTMTRLTHAAAYGANPVALLYLGEVFKKTAPLYDLESRCHYAMHAYTGALNIFTSVASQENHPLQDTAKYYLGRFYYSTIFYDLVPRTSLTSQTIFQLLSGLTTPQARLLRLLLRHKPDENNPPEYRPSFQDFTNIMTAEESEDPVFIARMYRIFENRLTVEEKVRCITQLIEKKPHFILHRSLANLYETWPEVRDMQQALVHWQAAADLGCAWSYEKCLSSYAPPTTVFHAFDLSNIADEQNYEHCYRRIQKMAENFGYPEAYRHLCLLLRNKPRTSLQQDELCTEQEEENDQAQAHYYLKEAAHHGLWTLYGSFKNDTDYPDREETREQLYALIEQHLPLETLPSKEVIHSRINLLLERSSDHTERSTEK